MQDQIGTVARQFGDHAQAYLTSAVHASGNDLDYLGELGRAHPGWQVLDLGCGAGHASFALAPSAARIVASDVSEGMLNVVAAAASDKGFANIETRRCRAEALPFADAQFDCVVTRFSAHHWSDVAAGLREASRVLRPGGRAVYIDVIAPADAMLDSHLQAVELLRDKSHARDHSEREWRSMIEASGLEITGARTWRLRMEFPVWVARSSTSPARQAAIRTLFDEAPAEVRDHFAVESDGSFAIDVAMFEARKPA